MSSFQVIQSKSDKYNSTKTVWIPFESLTVVLWSWRETMEFSILKNNTRMCLIRVIIDLEMRPLGIVTPNRHKDKFTDISLKPALNEIHAYQWVVGELVLTTISWNTALVYSRSVYRITQRSQSHEVTYSRHDTKHPFRDSEFLNFYPMSAKWKEKRHPRWIRLSLWSEAKRTCDQTKYLQSKASPKMNIPVNRM